MSGLVPRTVDLFAKLAQGVTALSMYHGVVAAMVAVCTVVVQSLNAAVGKDAPGVSPMSCANAFATTSSLKCREANSSEVGVVPTIFSFVFPTLGAFFTFRRVHAFMLLPLLQTLVTHPQQLLDALRFARVQSQANVGTTLPFLYWVSVPLSPLRVATLLVLFYEGVSWWVPFSWVDPVGVRLGWSFSLALWLTAATLATLTLLTILRPYSEDWYVRARRLAHIGGLPPLASMEVVRDVHHPAHSVAAVLCCVPGYATMAWLYLANTGVVYGGRSCLLGLGGAWAIRLVTARAIELICPPPAEGVSRQGQLTVDTLPFAWTGVPVGQHALEIPALYFVRALFEAWAIDPLATEQHVWSYFYAAPVFVDRLIEAEVWVREWYVAATWRGSPTTVWAFYHHGGNGDATSPWFYFAWTHHGWAPIDSNDILVSYHVRRDTPRVECRALNAHLDLAKGGEYAAPVSVVQAGCLSVAFLSASPAGRLALLIAFADAQGATLETVFEYVLKVRDALFESEEALTYTATLGFLEKAVVHCVAPIALTIATTTLLGKFSEHIPMVARFLPRARSGVVDGATLWGGMCEIARLVQSLAGGSSWADDPTLATVSDATLYLHVEQVGFGESNHLLPDWARNPEGLQRKREELVPALRHLATNNPLWARHAAALLSQVTTSRRLAAKVEKKLPPPISVTFLGPPQLGKSFVVGIVAKFLAAETDRPDVVNYNSGDHFDHITSTTGSLVMDDVNPFNVNTAAASSAAQRYPFSILSGDGQIAVKADLAEKGTVRAQAYFVVASVNSLNFTKLFDSRAAVLRRLGPVIRAQPKERFLVGGRFDGAKGQAVLTSLRQSGWGAFAALDQLFDFEVSTPVIDEGGDIVFQPGHYLFNEGESHILPSRFAAVALSEHRRRMAQLTVDLLVPRREPCPCCGGREICVGQNVPTVAQCYTVGAGPLTLIAAAAVFAVGILACDKIRTVRRLMVTPKTGWPVLVSRCVEPETWVAVAAMCGALWLPLGLVVGGFGALQWRARALSASQARCLVRSALRALACGQPFREALGVVVAEWVFPWLAAGAVAAGVTRLLFPAEEPEPMVGVPAAALPPVPLPDGVAPALAKPERGAAWQRVQPTPDLGYFTGGGGLTAADLPLVGGRALFTANIGPGRVTFHFNGRQWWLPSHLGRFQVGSVDFVFDGDPPPGCPRRLNTDALNWIDMRDWDWAVAETAETHPMPKGLAHALVPLGLEPGTAIHEGVVLRRTPEGAVRVDEVKFVVSRDYPHIDPGRATAPPYGIIVGVQVAVGECGCLLFKKAGGGLRLVGGLEMSIKKGEHHMALFLPYPPLYNPGEGLEVPKLVALGPPHERNPGNAQQWRTDNYLVLGSTTGAPDVRNYAAYAPSYGPALEKLGGFGVGVKFPTHAGRGLGPDGEYHDPLTRVVAKSGRSAANVRITWLSRQAIRSVFSESRSLRPRGPLPDLEVMVDETDFLPPINLNASGGPGFPGRKRDYVEFVDGRLRAGPYLVAKSRELLGELRGRPWLVTQVHDKSETKPLVEREGVLHQGHQRVFVIQAMSQSLLERSLAGPVIRAVLEAPETCVGMDAATDSDALIREFARVSADVACVDLGSAEAVSATPPFLDVVISEARDAGFFYRDYVTETEALLAATSYRICVYSGNVAAVTGLLASGSTLTTTLNSLFQVMYFRCLVMLACYAESRGRGLETPEEIDEMVQLFLNPTPAFREYVSRLVIERVYAAGSAAGGVYGDDGAFCIKRVSMRAYMALGAAMGIEQKSEFSVDGEPVLVPPERISFLSRYPVRHAYGYVLALNERSLVAPLLFSVRSKSVSPAEQYAGALRSVWYELGLHGPEMRSKWGALILEFWERQGYLALSGPLPSFEDVDARHAAGVCPTPRGWKTRLHSVDGDE